MNTLRTSTMEKHPGCSKKMCFGTSGAHIHLLSENHYLNVFALVDRVPTAHNFGVSHLRKSCSLEFEVFPVQLQVAPETHHTNLPRSSEGAEGHSGGSSNHCKEQDEAAGIASNCTPDRLRECIRLSCSCSLLVCFQSRWW